MGGAGSDRGGCEGKSLKIVRGRIVHRGCTGNAERQWPVTSGQYPELMRVPLASLAGQPRRLSRHELWLLSLHLKVGIRFTGVRRIFREHGKEKNLAGRKANGVSHLESMVERKDFC